MELVDHLKDYVPAYKIGSGDITWLEILEAIARTLKPLFLATGASDMREVDVAVKTILQHNTKLCLMQCNTNYTGDIKNFNYVNLNVLKEFKNKYPDLILGLSDHTPGLSTTLGAVALGARVIEKHFTDNNNRLGPDHVFSMNPQSWRDMVDRTRELELSLGKSIKQVEENERETVIVQRRSIRVNKDLKRAQ